MASNYQVIARRYRPQNFDQVIGQKSVVGQLFNEINENRVGHGYLLCGPRGTGKTSTARIFAKALCCKNGPTTSPCGECDNCQEIVSGNHLDIIEVDAATYTKADDTKGLLEGIQRAPFKARYKIYIIDEVHMLSVHSFNALLKSLEEPPDHVVFILATTNPEKIPETVISRCRRLNFERVDTTDIMDCLAAILAKENVTIADAERDSVLKAIALASEGGLRDAQVLLDQLISLGKDEITLDQTRSLLGVVETDLFVRLISAMAERNSIVCLEIVAELVDAGRDIPRFTKMFRTFLRDIMLLRVGADAKLATLAGDDQPEIRNIVQKISVPYLLNIIQQFMDLEEKMRGAIPPRFLLEFTLIKLTAIDPTMLLDPTPGTGAAAPKSKSSAKGTTARSAPQKSDPANGSPKAQRQIDPAAYQSTERPPVPKGGQAMLMREAVPEDNPSSGIEMIHTSDEDRFAAFIKKGGQQLPAFNSMLSRGKFHSANDNRIVIGLDARDRAMVDQLDKPERVKILRNIARDIWQRSLMIEWQVEESATSSPAQVSAEIDQLLPSPPAKSTAPDTFSPASPAAPAAKADNNSGELPDLNALFNDAIDGGEAGDDYQSPPMTVAEESPTDNFKVISFEEAIDNDPDFREACRIVQDFFGVAPDVFNGKVLNL